MWVIFALGNPHPSFIPLCRNTCMAYYIVFILISYVKVFKIIFEGLSEYTIVVTLKVTYSTKTFKIMQVVVTNAKENFIWVLFLKFNNFEEVFYSLFILNFCIPMMVIVITYKEYFIKHVCRFFYHLPGSLLMYIRYYNCAHFTDLLTICILVR